MPFKYEVTFSLHLRAVFNKKLAVSLFEATTRYISLK